MFAGYTQGIPIYGADSPVNHPRVKEAIPTQRLHLFLTMVSLQHALLPIPNSGASTLHIKLIIVAFTIYWTMNAVCFSSTVLKSYLNIYPFPLLIFLISKSCLSSYLLTAMIKIWCL